MMIISIGGGLGNQMFGYAFYESMKNRYPQQTIKLDIMHTFGHAHNGYELGEVFGLTAEECTHKELVKLSSIYPVDGPHYKVFSLLTRLKRKLLGIKKSCIMQKDFSEYEGKFFRLEEDKDYFLYGVFANAKYFASISDRVKEMYRFPEITDEMNLKWEEKIRQSNSVSMHIRHGDYVDWGIEILSEDFYRRAMKHIEEKVGKCTYFVFTDDPEYVKETYSNVEDLYVVEGNGGKNSYRDIQLMSLCKHNIIANSSFSFWGAYLNSNTDKIVIASDLPYTGCKHTFTCEDWTIISHK